ncbi:uncharacterized protein PGTG_18712 [Puccinia graminis f. sp. tritici CRL 75-36-700-3]|uniref:MI domain-containing protein n=1 Tax=Puccinia graminis f. sp. tritici (strain CRL 75-36-700-3 / race SCCL) TaxID=418459 RepID=E3L7Q5_PUCGT|nr:uncharacterized protein PGTG_18712 [Puccinia graminis f. sp. tritici CRL 75-36-700-3]EFP92580.2 hypothetical protein PGTG_18712 [Puccinia graminis f. sp. tritici CRL 75-36-700-3]
MHEAPTTSRTLKKLPSDHPAPKINLSERSQLGIKPPLIYQAPLADTDEQAERAIKSRVDEFFHVRSVAEAAASFVSLSQTRHHQLIHSLVEKTLEKKAADVDLTASLFQHLVKENIVPLDIFLKGFTPVIEQLDDTSIDVRFAYEFTGKLLKAAGLAEKEVAELAQKIDTEMLDQAAKRLLDGFKSAALQ